MSAPTRIHPRDPDDRPFPSLADHQREEAKAIRDHDFKRARLIREVKNRLLRRLQRRERA